MKKSMFVLFVVSVLTLVSRAMIVSAQESGQLNAMAEIAESNIIDDQLLQDLNTLAQQLNETASDTQINSETNSAVEEAQ